MNYGIALGSNLGDRLGHLQAAVAELGQKIKDLQVLAAAPVYTSAPVDCPADSPGFLNTVIEISTSLPPLALLRVTQAVEHLLGRPPAHEHHAPRTVDVDLLYCEAQVLHHPDLVLPHPRLTQRRFVLQPLADIRPDLLLPGQTLPASVLLTALPSNEPPLTLFQTAWIPPTPPPTSSP